MVADLLCSLSAQGAQSWVVDLRLNLGGNMWHVLAGIGPLAGEGKLGAFVRGEEQWPWYYAAGTAQIDGKVLSRMSGSVLSAQDKRARIAVLTSALTASSGEIIAISFLEPV